MNPLDALTDWYTLEQAAKRIGSILNHEISARDVLYLALDGGVKLSWRVTNRMACRVSPACVLTRTFAPEMSPSWHDFEGDVQWAGGHALRRHVGSGNLKHFATLSCFPVDSTQLEFVSGTFRFHPEFPCTHDWIALWAGRKTPEEEDIEWDWNKYLGVFLSDRFGQMWDFAEEQYTRHWDGDSDAINVKRKKMRANLPRIHLVGLQAVDMGSFAEKIARHTDTAPISDAATEPAREKNALPKNATVTPRSNAEWPWGNYETELLRHLAAAAAKWWVNYDPSDPTTAPTNAQVIAWLTDERNLSQNNAESIAKILRADNLRPGPR